MKNKNVMKLNILSVYAISKYAGVCGLQRTGYPSLCIGQNRPWQTYHILPRRLCRLKAGKEVTHSTLTDMK